MNTADEPLALQPVESGVWEMRGSLRRDNINHFFIHQLPQFVVQHNSAVIRIGEVEVRDSTVLALLAHWHLECPQQQVSFEINNQRLINLLQVHRIESLLTIVS